MSFFKKFFSPQKKTIALNRKLLKTPWGGGNQFVEQWTQFLKSSGYRVQYHLSKEVDYIFMIDPRKKSGGNFGWEEIRDFKKKNPKVKCIHRVNECDKRKGTQFMDKLLIESNQVADLTIFISQWLLDYFSEAGMPKTTPWEVVYNAADESCYYPPSEKKREGVFKIATHHWSDNWLKGFHEYVLLDELIAVGRIPNLEFHVIGSYPKEISWKKAILHPPTRGADLANLLRDQDFYITASRWEPGGMHQVEAVQCGLPLAYHHEGGGIVEYAAKCGVCFGDDLEEKIKFMMDHFDEYKQKARANSWTGKEMCKSYRQFIEKHLSAST